MQNKILLTTAAVAVLVFSTPAMADNNKFTGSYAGLTAGYSSGNIDAEYDFTPLGAGTFSGDENVNGLEGGLFAGYRYQFANNIVLGAEIGALLSNADGQVNDVLTAGDQVSLDKNHEFYVSLKPGYAIRDNTMLYLIGGYQRAEYELSYTDGTDSTSNEDSFDGFHFGAGAEYKPQDNLSVRFEYKNQQYSEESYTTAGIGTETYEGDEHTFRVGVAYNF